MSKTALCIGINNYPGTNMDLQGCVNDANDWAEVLQSRGYAVSTLLDAQATKAAMVQALTNVIGGAASGDSLVITSPVTAPTSPTPMATRSMVSTKPFAPMTCRPAARR